jgi:hypothetical protein
MGDLFCSFAHPYTKGGIEVVKYDWRKHISEELQRGMNSY